VTRLVILFALCVAVHAQTYRDRYFSRYPFDRWKQEPAISQIRWFVDTPPSRLSIHQRLFVRIHVAFDGREIEKRRGRGEMVLFFELTDKAGRHWRTRDAVDLTGVPKNPSARNLVYTQDAFVLPGDYLLALAGCDSENLEHSFLTRRIHVAPLRNDPLPDASRNLPPVEFLRRDPPPEGWFLPYMRNRVELTAATTRPVHIDLLMNLTASDRVAGSIGAFRRNMSVLVPAFRTLAGVTLSNGSIDARVLDLSRQVALPQTISQGRLDWRILREPLATQNPGIIDIRSLSSKAEMRQFFRDQILDCLRPRPENPAEFVIVLSAPVFLEGQNKLENAVVGKNPNQRVFYFRYRPVPQRAVAFDPITEDALPPAMALPSDDIERGLKSLGARVFDILSPGQFRKAIAEVLSALSRL